MPPFLFTGGAGPLLSLILTDLIEKNKRERRYCTRSMVLIKSATVTERIQTCAISNSDSKSNVLDRSALPKCFMKI
ncbi:hypothetical protein J6590_010098 [Homalodisca vitripennis]|nr:hypothetical protein J6590_010098 [Homalodisca vitripennis]